VQDVPGLPVAHCAHEIPDNKLRVTASRRFFISSPNLFS
jgi:hypothetical protein